jgi:hypothetical protein
MTWNYTGRVDSDRDKVRFYVGDTDESDKLVRDEEILFAIDEQPSLEFAAAVILRALAAKFSRLVSSRVGDVSTSNAAAVAKAFADRAKEFDPFDLSIGSSSLVLPSFGGLSISEKETLDEDTDAVQPSFRKAMDDIPGGPDDVYERTDERIRNG